jgi:hypothetical protein
MRELLFGIGIAGLFGFLPYAVKDMPPFVAWIGILGGLAICLLALAPIDSKLVVPISLIVSGALALIAGGALLYERHHIAPAPSEAKHAAESQGKDDLRKLSNVEVRNRIIATTKKMRVFESRFLVAESAAYQEPFSVKSDDPSFQAELTKRDRQMIARKENYAAEYWTTLHPAVNALRNEVTRRLGLYPPYPGVPGEVNALLDKHMIVGVRPITKTADYLDELSRKLL